MILLHILDDVVLCQMMLHHHGWRIVVLDDVALSWAMLCFVGCAEFWMVLHHVVCKNGACKNGAYMHFDRR